MKKKTEEMMGKLGALGLPLASVKHLTEERNKGSSEAASECRRSDAERCLEDVVEASSVQTLGHGSAVERLLSSVELAFYSTNRPSFC